MRSLIEIAPTVAALQASSIEDIAWAILDSVKAANRQTSDNTFSRLINSYQPPLHTGIPFSREQKAQIRIVISEAIGWLVSKGLVIVEYEGGHTYHSASRLAHSIDTDQKFESFVRASTISAESLHTSIRDTCWPLYVRGDFDTAVFAAFKRVEVNVREAGKLDAGVIGVNLMRAAFHKDNGPLTDNEAPEAEKDAMAHLFAGAIGLFKNPNSHRDVGLNDPIRAAEVLMFASHLIRMVESIDTE